MKKLFYSVCLIAVGLAVSCSKDSNTDSAMQTSAKIDMYNKATFANASQKDKEAYVKFHYLKLADYLASNFDNETIKEAIIKYSLGPNAPAESDLTKKQLSIVKNTKVSIKYLIENLPSNVVEDEKSAKMIELRKSLNAFTNVVTKSYMPDVLMPIIAKSDSSRRSYDATKPIFLLSITENATTTQTSYDGYQKNVSDVLTKLETPITESYAQGKQCITITMHNIGDNVDEGYGGGGGGGGGPYNDTTPNPWDVPLTTTDWNAGKVILWQLLVKQNKEDWANGGSEINIVGFAVSANSGSSACYNSFAMLGGSSYCGDIIGKRAYSADRDDVNNQVTFNITYIMHNADNNGQIAMYYCIFEMDDDILAGTRSVTITAPNGIARDLQYSSWQYRYDEVFTLLNSDVIHDTDGIRYRLRPY